MDGHRVLLTNCSLAAYAPAEYAFGGNVLGATNLTGHPTVVLPNGFSDDGHPTSICFTAGLYREGDASAIAHLYQRATEWHLKHPEL